MIGLIAWSLFVILVAAVIIMGVLGGVLMVRRGLVKKNSWDEVPDWFMLLGGSFLFLFCLFSGFAMLAFAVGDIKPNPLPDGCYHVFSDIKFIPAGKTPIVYNDRHFLEIPCSGL